MNTLDRTLDFEQNGGHILVTGNLTRETAGAAWKSRKDWLGSETTVTLDLSATDKVDSAGLGLLIQVKAELEKSGRSLSLQNVNKQLVSFAEVSGVTGLLSLSYDD